MNRCTGACAAPPFQRQSPVRTYETGWRFCATCDMAIRTLDTYCPCCGIRMRMHAKTSAAKRRRRNGDVDKTEPP